MSIIVRSKVASLAMSILPGPEGAMPHRPPRFRTSVVPVREGRTKLLTPSTSTGIAIRYELGIATGMATF